jgi:hypothetical protein
MRPSQTSKKVSKFRQLLRLFGAIQTMSTTLLFTLETKLPLLTTLAEEQLSVSHAPMMPSLKSMILKTSLASLKRSCSEKKAF